MSSSTKKRGRPRALTPEKQDEVIRLIGVGGSRKMAAKFVGVHVTTIADEAKRNDDFSDRLYGAEAKCYENHVRKISESNDWRAAAWFLARKWPEEFAEVKKHAGATTAGKELSPEQRKHAIDAILIHGG